MYITAMRSFMSSQFFPQFKYMIFQDHLPYVDTLKTKTRGTARLPGRSREKETENGRVTIYYSENEIIFDILKFSLAVRLRGHRQRKLEAFLATTLVSDQLWYDHLCETLCSSI